MIPFERILDLIADRPEGAKVDISAISRALAPTHAEIIATIERLIMANRLDRETLRRRQPKSFTPSGQIRGLAFDAEPSKPLFDAIDAERKRRGLSRARASVEIWGSKTRLYRIIDNPTCRRKTGDLIRAWINSDARARSPNAAPAEPPEPRAARKGGGVARNAAPPPDRDERENSKEYQGAPGTAREAPSAAESTAAKRIKDRAPIVGPAVPNCPAPPAHPRLAKAAERRDPTKPPPGYHEHRGPVDLTEATISRAQALGSPKRNKILAAAQERIDKGLSIGGRGISVHVKIAQRGLEDQRREADRLADPLEQAKDLIRRKMRLPVYSAEVSLGAKGKGKCFIGNRLVKDAEVIRYAGTLGA